MKYIRLFRIVAILLIIPFCAQAKFQHDKDDTLLQKGIDFYNKGEYESAIKILQQRLQSATADNDKITMQLVYNNLGNNYGNIGKSVEALNAYNTSVTLAEEMGDKKAKARTIKNIGALYSDNKDFDKGMQKYNEAETIALSVNDTFTIADCANNKGLIYEQQKKYNEALQQYQKAIGIYEQLKQDDRIAILYNNLGIVYKCLKDYDRSIQCYSMSLAKSQKINSKFLIAANQINIGNVYEMKGDYKKAIELNEQGLQTGLEINSVELITEAYGSLAEDHAKSGDFEKGFELYKKYAGLKDSFTGIERSKQLAEIQTKYETEKKEKQIVLLEKGKYRMMAIIGCMSLMLIIAFLLYNRQQIKQRQKREKAIADAEYNERMRIAKDVHDDIGSGLSKISLMAAMAQKREPGYQQLNNDVMHIASISTELVDNMRDLIWVLNPENTTLQQLVYRLREYCADYLDGIEIKATINFPDSVTDLKIHREGQRNIFLTVKEAINNCVKHARASEISITLKIAEGLFHVTVVDDGIGFDAATIKSGGNGLRNMRQRIESIGGTYTLTANNNKGATISIAVPLHKLAEAKSTL